MLTRGTGAVTLLDARCKHHSGGTVLDVHQPAAFWVAVKELNFNDQNGDMW